MNKPYEPNPRYVLVIMVLVLGIGLTYCWLEHKGLGGYGVCLVAAAATIVSPELVAHEAWLRFDPRPLTKAAFWVAIAVASVFIAAIQIGVRARKLNLVGLVDISFPLATVALAAVVVALGIWIVLLIVSALVRLAGTYGCWDGPCSAPARAQSLPKATPRGVASGTQWPRPPTNRKSRCHATNDRRRAGQQSNKGGLSPDGLQLPHRRDRVFDRPRRRGRARAASPEAKPADHRNIADAGRWSCRVRRLPRTGVELAPLGRIRRRAAPGSG